MTARRTVVIGSGISGLAAAYELGQAGRDVHVFEKSTRIGGCVSTTEQDGYLFELGPNSFTDNCKEILRLVELTGIEDQVIKARKSAKSRFLYMNGGLVKVPMSPREVWKSPMFTLSEKLRIFMERFVPKKHGGDSESVAEFFCRRFGMAPTRTLVDAFVSGIYAGDARLIGLKSAFPLLHHMETKHGSILKAMSSRRKKGKGRVPRLLSFRRGLSALIDAMADHLPRPVETSTSVQRLVLENGAARIGLKRKDGSQEEMTCDEVVLAAPAPVAAQLLEDQQPIVSDLLDDVVYAGIVSVQAGFDSEQLGTLPECFGFLVPRPQRMRTLGWLCGSHVFEGRAPEGKVALTGYIGGDTDQHILDELSESIRHQMLGELSLVVGTPEFPCPDFFSLVSQRPGLPQHRVGHDKRMAAIKQVLSDTAQLKLVGNYVGGTSLDNCITTAREAVDELLESGANTA